MKQKTTLMLTSSAVMLALGMVLSMFAVYKLPNGGSVTFASMVPIVLIALIYPAKWAVFVSFTYSMLQMAVGFYPPPTQDILSFVLVILLDYVLAFTVLGLAGAIARRLPSPVAGAAVGTAVVVLVRLACSFLSGILIWYPYAPEGTPVWIYSLGYNSSYMIPELIITTVVIVLLSPVMKSIRKIVKVD
ncbi:MAG: energy-coupled thiamine transporter ThiT [Eubacteriales bacterium]